MLAVAEMIVQLVRQRRLRPSLVSFCSRRALRLLHPSAGHNASDAEPVLHHHIDRGSVVEGRFEMRFLNALRAAVRLNAALSVCVLTAVPHSCMLTLLV